MRTTCVFFSALALTACAHNSPSSPAALPSATPNRGLAANDVTGTPRPSFVPNGETTAVYAAAEHTQAQSSLFSFASSSTSSTPVQQLPSQSDGSEAKTEMIDIEARYAVQCDAVAPAADRFRALVERSGARMTSDEATTGKRTEVTFEVRVPVASFETFSRDLEKLGAIAARDVKRRDVSKEYHDSELLLKERNLALARFEELLKNAKDVTETLAVEQQLERLRTEIDRIKSDMLWLKDRVAAATVRVRFFPSETSEEAVFAPAATLYPAIRATMFFDLRSETQRYGYVGGGLSIQFKPFGRALTFDIDVAHDAITDHPTQSDYAYLFLTGFDLYSDLLGGGRRKFLNPYIGFRAGYAITSGAGDFAFGGVIGVDLIKTKSVLVDLRARVLGLVGNDQGPHVLVGPDLGFNFAF